MKPRPQLSVIGTGTRRCLECGARWSNCPPEATICKLCGGDLAATRQTTTDEWAK